MLATIIVLAIAIAVCVGIHYEALHGLSYLMSNLHIRSRIKIILGVLGALLAHVAEIIVFALGYTLLTSFDRFGSIKGELHYIFRDHIYFSFVSYTSLGYGDLVPVGPIRIYAGGEALAGLILIAWSASFLFVQMQRYWEAG